MTVAINGRFLLSSFGGARRFATELTERLARLRGDVVLLTPPLPDDLEVPDVRIETVGRFHGPLWEQVELPLWLRRRGRPLLLNPATIAPIAYSPQISVVHDIAPALRPHDFTALFRVQWQLAVRFGMLRRGQQLVTISDVSRREISDHFGVDPSSIEVVYPGADSLATTEAGAVARAGADPAPSFLVFGRHGAAKNVRTVIDAAAELPPSSAITVHLIGQLDPALKSYALEKKVPRERLLWRGRLSDAELSEAYRQTVGFIWPSLHEGFGLPPVEAQSLGVPVIASDIPINREILGESALYFSAPSSAELASSMVELSTDAALRATLSASGLDNSRRFSWEGTALGWNELIRRRDA